jgi:hypothetical protein
MPEWTDPAAPWRSEPATEAQRRKLHFYGRRCPDQLTKGHASDMIDDAMARHPEKEDVYQQWKEAEDDFERWYYEVVDSDFCEEGDIRKPTKEMVRDTIEALDATQPNWRDGMGGNALALILEKRYPELARKA